MRFAPETIVFRQFGQKQPTVASGIAESGGNAAHQHAGRPASIPQVKRVPQRGQRLVEEGSESAIGSVSRIGMTFVIGHEILRRAGATALELRGPEPILDTGAVETQAS